MHPFKAMVFLATLIWTMNMLRASNYRNRPRPTKRVESILPCFLAEYTRWRKLEQVVLFVNKKSGVMDLVRSLNKRGIFVGLQSMTDPLIPSAIHIPRHRLGAVVFLGPSLTSVDEEFLEQVSQKQLFHAYVSWLIVTEKTGAVLDVNGTVEERLKYLNIGPDTDLVVATLVDRTEEHMQQNVTRTTRRKYNNSNLNNNNNNNNNMNQRDQRAKRSPSLRKQSSYGKKNHSKETVENSNSKWNSRRKENRTRTWHNKNSNVSEKESCREHPDKKEYSGLEFVLVQVWKIRPSANSTLIIDNLGSWNTVVGTLNLAVPTGIEQHNDFRGQPLIVGIKNASQSTMDAVGGAVKDLSSQSSDDEMDDDNHLMDLLDFIARSLNTSYELVPFTKLGWQNEEKAWLFMLGAVTSGTIDLGLDNVVITQDRSRDMFFTLPIVQSMKNIYFRRPESSAMRDIFLAPFSPRLLLSVAATGVVIAIVMVLVNASRAKYEKKMQPNSNVRATTKWSFGEAIVWSISVLCMQGSSWSPKTPSGCLVLIFSLCFALVIYNAYAAFITSVLSVRVASIRGLDDLLESDFQFGYTLRGQDEAYLRTVNDIALRRLYFRGLVRNHGVEEASAGLMKASSGGYAFFVSARLARKALNSFIAQDKRCAIQELTVEATKSAIALPMGFTSPYRRLINLSLLRMREAGVLGPIQEQMLPPMPRCKAYSAFNSASLLDVYSAFLVLGGGLGIAVFMGLSEKVWNRRASLLHWVIIKWSNKDKPKTLHNEIKYPVQMPKRPKFHYDVQWID